MPYQVTLSEGGAPNCAGVYTENIEYNGYMSYRCVNEAGTWYLWSQTSNGDTIWYLSESLGIKPVTGVIGGWVGRGTVGGNPEASIYKSVSPATGIATVAEYVPPADPVLRGKLFLLISHVNGVELASPKKITLAEFDE